MAESGFLLLRFMYFKQGVGQFWKLVLVKYVLVKSEVFTKKNQTFCLEETSEDKLRIK